jgi:DNA-binding CsgD family transcriptional regulator
MHYPGEDFHFEDESMLFKAVGESSLSVAVYDVVEPAVLALSPSARAQLGFVDVDLAAVNIVERASNPDGVRTLLALICDGQLKEWKFRSWLRGPGGEGYWDYGVGRLIEVGSRRLGFVSYPSLASSTTKRGEKTISVRGETSDRVVELEDHLRRILREVEAAGLARSSQPGDSALRDTPNFDDLSPREVEIVTRMYRGERVAAIAKSLYLSPSTVRNHLCSIYRKFGIHSQAELIEILQHASNRQSPRAS